MKTILIFVLFGISVLTSLAQSGGPLNPLQGAYDVTFYDFDLNIRPDIEKIDGSVACKAHILQPIDTFLLDLVDYYTIDSIIVKINNSPAYLASFIHTDKLVKILLEDGAESDDLLTAKVYYRQTADIPSSKHPIHWDKASDGITPWVSTSCESEGPYWWWPCKDHPSDEADSVSLKFTVPDTLECASNGIFQGAVMNGDGTKTYHWFTSTSINNYLIAFNLADYLIIEDSYTGILGNEIPFYFWVVEDSFNDAMQAMNLFKSEFDYIESVCGPFPFSHEKHAFAQIPSAAMEHQTIISYGGDFEIYDLLGYDYYHFHETVHEWFGNLLSAKSWSDIWIHEGVATYIEVMYIEEVRDVETSRMYLEMLPFSADEYPLAPREEMNSLAIYNLDPYSRGAWVLHTLRYYLGDDVFRTMLQRWLYPVPGDYNNENGRLCRLATTDDLMNEAEQVTGRELDNFFEVFFREITLPYLTVDREADTSWFTWNTESNVPLDLNVPVLVNGEPLTVEMQNGEGYLPIHSEDTLTIDPEKWLLMGNPIVTGIIDNNVFTRPGVISQNLPNPFHRLTTIFIHLPESSHVTLTILDVNGRVLETLLDEFREVGTHRIEYDSKTLKPGLYLYNLKAGELIATGKMLVN